MFGHCEVLDDAVISISVTKIECGAFQNCPLNNLRYLGTKNQWENIEIIRECNEKLYDGEIKVHYAFDYSPEATGGKCGENLTWALNTNGVLTISGYGEMYIWDTNHTPWDANKEYIEKIIIQDGVRNISTIAFKGCSILSDVEIADSVWQISSGAFSECKNLKNINIPASVESIGTNPFTYCGQLNINVDKKNINYSDIDGVLFDKSHTTLIAYAKDTVQEKYNIPSETKAISALAFSGSYSLTDVYIPDSVTEIGVAAFDDCTSLANINIPKYITSINKLVFSNCRSLKNVVLPDGITAIDIGAFQNCSSLTDINISDNVKAIAEYAFNGCDDLKNINIPEGIKNIYQWTFAGCNSLKNITIPSTVKSIGDYAFYCCYGLEIVEIPEGVTDISSNAFYGCKNLKCIMLPSSITEIGYRAFNYCDNLYDVYYAANKSEWDKISIGNDNYYLSRDRIHYNTNSIPVPEILDNATIVEDENNYEFFVEIDNIPYTCKLIAVLYQDDVFVRMNTIEMLSYDTSKNFTISDCKANSAKLFLWDSLNSMKSLCEAKYFTITQ